MTRRAATLPPGGAPTAPHDGRTPGAGDTARRAALVAAAVAALAPMVWGTTYAVTTELLPEGRPVFAGVARSLPAGLVVVALTRQLPRGEWWWRAAVLGVANIGLFFAMLFVAAYRLPGGIAATAGALSPLAVIVLARVLLGEVVTGRRLVAALVGVVGVALLVLDARAALDPIGLAAAAVGVVSMASGVVLTRAWGRPPGTSLIAFTGWQLTAGGAFLSVVLVATEGVPGTISWTALGGYTWLAVPGSLVAYTLWFRGISRLPAPTIAFLGLLSPVVASTVGWALLGESLTPIQLAGFVAALGAVAVGASSSGARPSPPVAAPIPPAGPTSRPHPGTWLVQEVAAEGPSTEELASSPR